MRTKTILLPPVGKDPTSTRLVALFLFTGATVLGTALYLPDAAPANAPETSTGMASEIATANLPNSPTLAPLSLRSSISVSPDAQSAVEAPAVDRNLEPHPSPTPPAAFASENVRSGVTPGCPAARNSSARWASGELQRTTAASVKGGRRACCSARSDSSPIGRCTR